MSSDTSKASEVRAGLFVVLAMGILALGTLWIVGFKPFAGRLATYEVLMSSSSGVRRGDRVRVSGIEAGRVKKVQLNAGEEWPVTFVVALDKEVSIAEGSSARITTDGLLGAPYLELLAGPVGGAVLAPGSRIYGSSGGSLTETLGGLGEVTDRLPTLLEETTQLIATLNGEVDPLLVGFQRLLSEENIDSVSETLAKLGPTLDELGPRLAALVSGLDSLAAEFEEGVSGLPGLTEEIGTLAADMRGALGEDGSRLAGVLDSAVETLGSARGALSPIEGNRVEIEALLRDLREAAANLKALSQTLKERPSLLLRYPRPTEKTNAEDLER